MLSTLARQGNSRLFSQSMIYTKYDLQDIMLIYLHLESVDFNIILNLFQRAKIIKREKLMFCSRNSSTKYIESCLRFAVWTPIR